MGLQSQLHEWRTRNFPYADADQQLLGIVEEVGELAHANLKRKQGIRGSELQHTADEMDAVGDLVIYLMGYCSYRGWNIHEVTNATAYTVMQRDWIKYLGDGLTK